MDKRWRNLGILFVVVVVAIVAYLFLPSLLAPQSISSVLLQNEYTPESLSFSLSSYMLPLDDGLLKDLKKLQGTSSGDDKKLLDAVVSLESDKNEMMGEYFGLLQQDVLTRCDNFDAAEKSITAKAQSIREKVADLSSMKSSIQLDINNDNMDQEYEDMLVSFTSQSEQCFNMWELMDYSYYDR